MHTFFLPAENWREPYFLEGQEAKHLIKVLRIKNGESIRLLDGAGRSGNFTVSGLEKNRVQLVPLSILEHPLPTSRCFLAAAYTKATRRSWILEKAVELEAGGIWFWQAERSQAKTPEDGKENWHEQLVAGAKQCLNPWLPELRTFPDGAGSLAREVAKFSRAFLLWEDEATDNMLSFSDISPVPAGNSSPGPYGGDTLFIMGPEGGLGPDEASLFQRSGCKSVSLGQRVLRWETAALLCLGLGFWARQLTVAQQ